MSPAAIHGDEINKVSGHHLFWRTCFFKFEGGSCRQEVFSKVNSHA